MGHSSLCFPRSAVALGNMLIWCSAKKARETCLGLVKGQVQALLPTVFVSSPAEYYVGALSAGWVVMGANGSPVSAGSTPAEGASTPCRAKNRTNPQSGSSHFPYFRLLTCGLSVSVITLSRRQNQEPLARALITV